MMRLTPRKVSGYTLPKHERINKGNTSIIYRTDDPNMLEVFTVECLKMDWWRFGLNLISDYEDVATAYYEGFDHSAYRMSEFKHVQLPVYRCLVPVLQQPDKEQRRYVRAATAAMANAKIEAMNKAQRSGYRSHLFMENVWLEFQNLAEQFPQVGIATDFAIDYGASDTYADLGVNDWMVWNGELIWLDPFHRTDVNAALRLTAKP